MGQPITILGAGAIGCALAAAWRAAGAEVHLVARSARTGANPVRFADGDVLDAGPVHAGLTGAPISGLVVVTVKATAIEGVAGTLAQIPNDTPILSLLNGPFSATALGDLLGRPVHAGMVPWNVVRDPAGWRVSGAGDVTVDHALKGILPETPRAPTTYSADIEGVLWGKLLLNLVNPVNALSGLPLPQMLAHGLHRARYRAAYVEALGILRAAGIRPAKVAPLPPRLIPHVLAMPDPIFRRVFLPLQRLEAGATTSMAQDVAAGRVTEIDWINGAVVTLAHKVGMQAPVNAALVADIRALSPH
ncbi:MAG: 2-dehydropantoate 2-reductase [Pseudomonadota bacterium]